MGLGSGYKVNGVEEDQRWGEGVKETKPPGQQEA